MTDYMEILFQGRPGEALEQSDQDLRAVDGVNERIVAVKSGREPSNIS